MPVGNSDQNKRTLTNRPRLRYAPSPTGDPHVGNIRQAVWSWLHAKRYGGDFIVRLEDTDQSRAQPGADKRILDSLRWLGVEWDEGPDIGGEYAPYIQSHRLDLYHDHIKMLLKNDAARRCFCSPERLTEIREEQQANKLPPGIRDCCDIAPEDAEARAAAGESYVVRFKTPREGTTVATDLLRGDISFENSTLDDFVLLKSDGFPTYHLAHVVDDHAMDITLVTRGEEWISSLPRHALLFDAFGYDRPEYAHASVIKAPGGGKLSKRDGAKSILEYAEDGYLPETLLNFLCLTGWGHGDQTLFSRSDLLSLFDMSDITLASATFDHDKLAWLNGTYIRALDENVFVTSLKRQLELDLPVDVPRPLDEALIESIAPLIQERITLMTDAVALVDFFWQSKISTPPPEDFLVKKWRDRAQEASATLERVGTRLNDLPDSSWNTSEIEALLRNLAEELSLKAGELLSLVRTAVTGKRISPPLFESMEIVGKGLVVERINEASSSLS
ncbi:MAG: glutamate--tRNA ligase [Dehalococcoidia bacterium]|nr:glutamate--tRNA ligase [Dehalococcoidia bacterium]